MPIQVRIFVAFKEHSSAAAALKALNLRWFAGRQITCTLTDQRKFEMGDYS